MESYISLQYIMKMMVYHDCHALFEKLSLRLRHWWLECTYVGMSDEQVRTNVKDNDESHVLFMKRRKEWREMNDSVFLWVVFSFCLFKYTLSKSVIVTDTVNLLEHLSLCWNDFSANVNHWQLLLIAKLMCCPKEQRTSVKKFTTVIMFVWWKALWVYML